jgi:hypothetical protein
MRSLFLTGLAAASLVFAGNGAMAANIQAKSTTKTTPAAHARVAAHYRYPANHDAYGQPYSSGQPYSFGQPFGFGQPQVNPQQIIASLLNSPLVAPYLAQYGGRIRVTRGSSGGSYDPSYDSSPSPTVDSGPSMQDQLNTMGEDQAIQEMNDTNAMTASNAAADAQNAADSAAMTQQIDNNGGL